jgi:hypothetical protein
MFSKTKIMTIGLLFGRAIAAPGAPPAIEARDTFQCCRCTDNGASADACAAVNFGLCGNGNGACGIWVGHVNDVSAFASACVAQSSSFGQCT